jgi:outer membrane protein assembly factor BamA
MKCINIKPFVLLLMLSYMIVHTARAQDKDTMQQKKECEPVDVGDILKRMLHAIHINIKEKKKEKTSAIFLAPVLGSSPSAGFIYGVTFQGAFQLPQSKLSAFAANIQYTTKKQFSVTIKNNVFAKKNKLFLSGDWSYFDYSQPTYGLGTNAPGGTLPYYLHYNNAGDPSDSFIQPMTYKYYKIHQTISFEVVKNFFIGPGIHYDHYQKINDQKLDTPVGYITSHYAYSLKYGFDPGKYTVFGLSLNLLYDSRDNMITPTNGIFANVNYRVNPEFMGSDKSSSVLWTEFRTYIGLSKKRPEKLLAFWLAGQFTVSGVLPYLNLPALGNDQRNKTGRGYTIARFRGNHMVYGETEFRFPLSGCKRTWGGVIFGNAVTTSNTDANIPLFKYVKFGYGAGIRILFNKRTGMNMAVDYGHGDHSGGIYFAASEVF